LVAGNSGKEVAGDLAISADIAQENAKRLGHPVAEEIKILVLHGILHLAGFDHEKDNGEMARQERRLRRRLKLELGLIDRVKSGDHQASNRARPTPRRSAGRKTA
jgi:probable rRNA maturation factor